MSTPAQPHDDPARPGHEHDRRHDDDHGPAAPRPAGTDDDRDWSDVDWDELYRERGLGGRDEDGASTVVPKHAGHAWSGLPNATVVDQLEGLDPTGTAVDLGCGEGADALWLAGRGWSVTGLDVSTVALGRARSVADATPGLADRVAFAQQDLAAWRPAPGSADLVTTAFLHLPVPVRDAAFRAAAGAVAVGGTLLVVGHSAVDLAPELRDSARAALLWSPDEVAALLDAAAWRVEVADVVVRPGVTGADAHGHRHDTVVRAVRTA